MSYSPLNTDFLESNVPVLPEVEETSHLLGLLWATRPEDPFIDPQRASLAVELSRSGGMGGIN